MAPETASQENRRESSGWLTMVPSLGERPVGAGTWARSKLAEAQSLAVDPTLALTRHQIVVSIGSWKVGTHWRLTVDGGAEPISSGERGALVDLDRVAGGRGNAIPGECRDPGACLAGREVLGRSGDGVGTGGWTSVVRRTAVAARTATSEPRMERRGEDKDT